MPTHQSLGGASDEELLQRMVATYDERFAREFWAFFDAHVGRRLPARAVIVDLGWGRGSCYVISASASPTRSCTATT